MSRGGELMDADRIYDSLLQCWQIKCMISFFVSLTSFLIGEINVPFIALWSLIFLDMITKWGAIGKKILDEQEREENVFYGIVFAWKTGRLSSRNMRVMFASKIFSYLTLIIAANLLVKIIPSVLIFGNDWAKMPTEFIYSFLALTEMMSIIENLIALGIDALQPLEGFLSRKRAEIAGYQEKEKE